MAGFIFASLAGKSDQEKIDYATAAGAMKHTIEGDVNVASVREITALLEGENIGKLLR
jgi:2-dehydro-3-deoxygluconokinase